MRIPLPKTLDSRQLDADTRGLALVAPTVTASSTDDNATTLALGDAEHRVPADWTVAEARSGAYTLALLRRGSEVRVLVGTRDSGVREIRGYSPDVRSAILETRFGEKAQQTTEDREVDRLAALSDSMESAVSDDPEIARLLKLSEALD